MTICCACNYADVSADLARCHRLPQFHFLMLVYVSMLLLTFQLSFPPKCQRSMLLIPFSTAFIEVGHGGCERLKHAVTRPCPSSSQRRTQHGSRPKRRRPVASAWDLDGSDGSAWRSDNEIQLIRDSVQSFEFG